jgi:predicted phosphoadenosine phosphosulfate sulfurtransferase
MDQVFSGGNSGGLFGDLQTTGSDGYLVQKFLVPYSFSEGQVDATDDYGEYGGVIRHAGEAETVSYGLNIFPQRTSVLWSSLVNTTALMTSELQGWVRALPADAVTEANAVQFASQENTETEVGTCPLYASSTLTGSYTSESYDAFQSFSSLYTDAAFVCDTCR